MAQDPNLALGKAHDASTPATGYQVLSPITQDTSSGDSDYDYPTNPLLLVHETKGNQQLPPEPEKIELFAAAPPGPPGFIADMSSGEARELPSADLNSLSYHLFQDVYTAQDPQDSFSSSGGESSDICADSGEPAVIRQVHSLKKQSSAPPAEDQKIFITGNLGDTSCFMQVNPAPITDEEFADEGIYQGLVMTDVQKKDLGILPESLYMTTNLIKRGDLIESMLLSVPAVAVEVPEVPLPPTSPPLFTRDSAPVFDTIPKSSPPLKPPRRRGKGPHS